jgi:hypothetical protein
MYHMDPTFTIHHTAIGFVFGAFLGLIAMGLYLFYIFLLVKRPQPPPDPKVAKQQKVRALVLLGHVTHTPDMSCTYRY